MCHDNNPFWNGKTHRRPVRRQKEQQQDEHADASKRDELLWTLAGV